MEERIIDIDLEPETWDVLYRWSEQECRTVAGQIKYLVKQYAPSQLVAVKQRAPTIRENLKPRRREFKSPCAYKFSKDENGWDSAQLRITHLKSSTQKMSLLETIIEYNEPLTNTDLLLLAQAKYPNWKSLDIDVVNKQTSAIFHDGLLKRRASQNLKQRDQFQYILHPRAMRLVKRTRLLHSSSPTESVYTT